MVLHYSVSFIMITLIILQQKDMREVFIVFQAPSLKVLTELSLENDR